MNFSRIGSIIHGRLIPLSGGGLVALFNSNMVESN